MIDWQPAVPPATTRAQPAQCSIAAALEGADDDAKSLGDSMAVTSG
jgi:hypothetical protein